MMGFIFSRKNSSEILNPGSLAPLPIPQGLMWIRGVFFVFSASASSEAVYGFTPNINPANPPAFSTFRRIVIRSVDVLTSSATPASALP